MGIKGLIPFCEQATKPITIAEIKGKTVAVDSYCLLHRGSYSCSDKLIKNITTTAHIDFCMKYVNMLLSVNITPIMVFDGRNLPAKAETELKRRKDRDAAKKKAKEYLQAGKIEEARKEFTKAVDITHKHAVELMKECRKVGVDCITAMYEADSQLAYLNNIGVAEYIVSEDSDLILFGSKKIIFKLQLDGRCLLFESEKLHLSMNTSRESFCFEKFRRMCILSGCDYLKNLPGIGLSKARKFMLMTEETDMRIALPKIPSYLNIKKLTITSDYIDDFLKAEATFKYMFVYDPVKREMLRLNPLTEHESEKENCSNAGELLDRDAAYQLALGNIDPRSFECLDDFNPDTLPPKKNVRTYKSIWHKDIIEDIKKTSQPNISQHFSMSSKTVNGLVEVQNIIDQENRVTSESNIEDIVSSYYTTQSSSLKRRNTDLQNRYEAINNDTLLVNPFAKRRQTDKNNAARPSLINSISLKQTESKKEKNQFLTVSKYFQKSNLKDSEDSSDESGSELKQLQIVHQKRQLINQQFYGILKNQDESDLKFKQDSVHHPEIIEKPSSFPKDLQIEHHLENVVDLDQYEFKAKLTKQSLICEKKPLAFNSIKRKKGPCKTKSAAQKTDKTTIQSKLSKFGFQKKSGFM